MLTKPVLTLEDAKRVAAAAEVEARANNWGVVIAIVDDGGHLLYLQRAHDVQFGSIETAIMKARTSIAYRRTTKAAEDAVAGGRLVLMTLPGMVPVEGGVPLMHEGVMIGAIGISGVRSAEDGQIALAGAAAL